MLPVSWASSFPLWVIDGDEHADDTGRKHVAAVPGPSEELGWVNPRRFVYRSTYVDVGRVPSVRMLVPDDDHDSARSPTPLALRLVICV